MLYNEEGLQLRRNLNISKNSEAGIRRYFELIRVVSMHWGLCHRGLRTRVQALLGRQYSQ